ncbi:laminin subunit beta-4 isoform X2 [Anabas testudineus]|uniref:laminin subunit beta-4 isoform X2 n=1 Tax=Anabas testudineus TaxID=64144 RepID=UPI000E459317|nr:laminin subunit beta-4 isoform X2 [Anabas testudineus]XP_026221369.1 laminin subunit beta-4 isoform X2 [Anabas testudineus]XP_026221370.1 laminin subunit beta-4 isoform X2 [Anabas testudineus]XP_026221371.1 laminin subunit beta-4 isoform X2 [Anabas testudineus]
MSIGDLKISDMIFIFFICLLPAAQLQLPQDFQDLQEFQDLKDDCPGGFCSPQLGDLMLGRAAQLSASSTCGLHGPQNYCIIGYLEEEQKCFTCDSQLAYNSTRNPNSHRIENVIMTFDPKSKLKWWQSENGVHQVSVQLDLETVFQFSHLVLTFKSFRPAAMLVERSKDFGQTWKVFRYFADDCLHHFPSVSNKPANNVDDIVCDSKYSGSEPSTDGEVVLKSLDPVFEIRNPYTQNIQDLIRLTNLRVNFTRLFTLGDTLLSRRRRDPQDNYYYALYNMVVRGSCFCNGHSKRCTPVDGGPGGVLIQAGVVHGRCVCRHNTAGENCERCQDFHHDSPWRPGGGNTADICRRCNCHGHSDSCHFDAARFEASGGVSGGICDNCGHNRTGPHCERCRPFLYQDPRRTRDDPHACISCDCDPAGSQGGGLCDALTGQCVCKENVEGQRCNRCKHGFFGLRQDNADGCQVCRCHVLGSIGSCDQLTGSCECDHFTIGLLCDQCLEGFWGLGNSVYKCSPCDCDIGGAHSNMCSQEDGQCECLPNMIGRHCSDPAPGYFLPSLDYFLYEAELAALLNQGSSTSSTTTSSLVNTAFLPQCKQYFKDQGFDFKFNNRGVVLVRRTQQLTRRIRLGQQTNIPLNPGHALPIIPLQGTNGQRITWTGLGWVKVSEGAGLRFTVDNLTSSMEFQLVIRYETESPSDWLASVSIITLLSGDGSCSIDSIGSKTLNLPANSRAAILESTVCLNAGGRYFVDIMLNKQSGSDGSHILIDSMGLISRIESVHNFCSQSDLDSFHHFRCTGLAAEQESLPRICEGLTKSMSARIHNGAVRCRCNPIGSLSQSCTKLGGFCECKLNVIGHCCDTCAPLTFDFGPDGCKPCECDPQGSMSELCDQVRGQCACRLRVTGRQCNHCQNGFWDFPFCRPCECNGLSDVCDEETGECLNCREHTTGPHCDRCVEGYYSKPISGLSCQPCLCPEVKNSGRFFATSCQHDPQSFSPTCNCREGHTGPHCDRCSPGFYGNLMIPGSHCKQCPCNSNIDPDDPDACDSLTGECLQCLHNTTGPHCQNCKPGYCGNAVSQNCKECSCDRRGTEVTQCPLGSPCFCDQSTGQCPCRRGVVGVLCNQCEDGYWNLDGVSGCQSCNCDPVNSLSNICNKVTGQCPCHSEFGGRQCDECGENHFGNPALQCISCDCKPEGTEDPSCDAETGECLCRVGVTGILCDKCAAGYNSVFPACEECHPCTALWAKHVIDVQRAAKRMKTFIPHQSNSLLSGDYRQQIHRMYSNLDNFVNLIELSPPKVEKLEKLYMKIWKLKDTIDLKIILIDLSPLLNTEMDNIHLDCKKLLNNLKEKPTEDLDQEEDLEELLYQIQNFHDDFLLDERKLRNANTALEDSMDTRQDIKHKLSMCSSRGDLGSLEKKIKELSVADLNTQICGGTGLKGCSGCGGALCAELGQRKCGGLNCEGIFSISQKTSETVKRAKDQLNTLPFRLEESKNKINDARQVVQHTKGQAKDLQDRTNINMNSFMKGKNQTWELTQRAKAYLMDEMVPAEDIKKVAQAVLNFQLPWPPDQIQSVIHDIYNLQSNATNIQDGLKNLHTHTKTGQGLLQKAQELKEQTKEADVREIIRDIDEEKEVQDKANADLESASRDANKTRDQIQKIKEKINKIEPKLMNCQPEDLQNNIKALTKKTEQNKEMARDAQEAAESALNTTSDTEADLDDVMKQFDVLKQKKWNQAFQGEAAARLKNIMDEVKNMKRQVDDKLRQILDLEQRILQLINRKQQKSAEVSSLLEVVDSLQQEISRRAEVFAKCTS